METKLEWAEAIKRHIPQAARQYRLQREAGAEQLVYYPSNGYFQLEPFEYPEVTDGRYRVLYYTDTGVKVTPREVGILIIDVEMGLRAKEEPKVQRDEPPRHTASRPRLEAALQEPAGDEGSVVDDEDDSADEDAEEAAAAARELRRQQREEAVDAIKRRRIDHELHQIALQQQLEDNQQELLYKGGYVREVAEHYQMNRAMRSDIVQLSRALVENSKTIGEALSQFSKLHFEGMASLKQQLDQYVRPAAPPPPPDYSGVGMAAVGLLRDVAVSIIQRVTTKDEKTPQAGVEAASKDTKQLPAPADKPPAEAGPSVPAPTVAPVDVKPPGDAARGAAILERLRGLDEQQVAVLMSSPELMEKFFSLLNGQGERS